MTGTPTRICVCGAPTAAAHFSKCARCLLGLRKQDKVREQVRKAEGLPPPDVLAGGWSFRMPGRPMGINHAYIQRKGQRHRFLKPEAKEWKQTIAAYALRARPSGWRLDQRYRMTLHSCFESSLADVDGPLKLVQDALKGVAWNDDRLVLSSGCTKEVDRSAPRIEVSVAYWRLLQHRIDCEMGLDCSCGRAP